MTRCWAARSTAVPVPAGVVARPPGLIPRRCPLKDPIARGPSTIAPSAASADRTRTTVWVSAVGERSQHIRAQVAQQHAGEQDEREPELVHPETHRAVHCRADSHDDQGDKEEHQARAPGSRRPGRHDPEAPTRGRADACGGRAAHVSCCTRVPVSIR